MVTDNFTETDRYGAGVDGAGVRHTPGPWVVGFGAHSIVCTNAKIGGEAKLFDVRGWGYLIGQGHGGLGLDPKTALAIQEANAHLAAAAPDMLEALRAVDREATAMRYDDPLARLVRAAIAKAEGTAAISKATPQGGVGSLPNRPLMQSVYDAEAKTFRTLILPQGGEDER